MNVPDSVSLAVVAISSSNNKFLGSSILFTLANVDIRALKSQKSYLTSATLKSSFFNL